MIKIKSRLMRKGLIVIVLPLVLELCFISMLTYFLVQAQAEIDRRIESKKIVATATAIVARIIDAQLISFVYNAQRIPTLDVRFDEDSRLTSDLVNELKRRCTGSPERIALSKEIESSVNDTFMRLRRVFTDEIEQNAPLAKFAATAQLSEKTYSRMTGAFKSIDRLLQIEQRMQNRVQEKEKDYRENIRQSIVLGVGLNVLLTIVLAVYFARTITARLAVVLSNTDRLLKRQELKPPISGNDELWELDQVFHATSEELAVVDKQRKHLVSLVKEELSEPLRQVQYTLHNLSQGVLGDLTPKAESRLILAAKDTDRVMRLIDDLLSIETMEGAKFDLDIEEVSTKELVASAIGSIKDMADRHNVKLETLGTDVVVGADRDRLIQVLINFLSNAIKYSPSGGTVTLSVTKDDDNVEFQVIDRGRGVPLDKTEKIFEPFQQVDAEDQSLRGGTGLGLPISKTIVEQHGGTIGVTSKMGEGSRFWFRIPRASK